MDIKVIFLEFLLWLKSNILFLTPFIISIIPLGIQFWIAKKAKKDWAKEIEREKHELKRRYLIAEIKTKNLVEVYPLLYSFLRKAGFMIVLFDALEKRLVIGISQREDFIVLFRDYIEKKVCEYPYFGLKKIESFVDCLESKFLFISEKVSRLAESLKLKLFHFYRLIKNEIISNSYEKYSLDELIDLLDRARKIVKSINEDRDAMKQQMLEELRDN